MSKMRPLFVCDTMEQVREMRHLFPEVRMVDWGSMGPVGERFTVIVLCGVRRPKGDIWFETTVQTSLNPGGKVLQLRNPAFT